MREPCSSGVGEDRDHGFGGNTMKGKLLYSTIISVMVAVALALAQSPPAIEQLRQSVSRLRGNRIETPNNYDKLTPQQKKYAESILSGPRNDISGPLGVMMVTPELGDLTQKAIAYSRFAGREGFSSV